ncbi:MAG: hypothetical protein HY299_02750 [Verrucomicrobia bacterium]|nr:hypothetical protein [Verrucomicrobiota bacterium]
MKAWPFLITKNHIRGFSMVTIPEFLQKAGAAHEVVRACSNEFQSGAGEAIYLKGYHESVGVVDMVFRVVQGTERMLGKDSDAILRDDVRRPIPLYEGLVLTERLPDEQLHFTQVQLDAAHKAVEGDFRTFWEAGSDWKVSRDWKHITSDAIELPVAAATGDKLRLHIKESPNLHPPAPPSPPPLREVPPAAQALPKFAPPESPLPALEKDLPKSGMNKTVVFGVVAAVAIGAAYLAYRHSSKPKTKQHGFVQRVGQERQTADIHRNL